MSDYSDGFTKGFVDVKLAQAGARRVIDHLLDIGQASSGMAVDAIARQRAAEAEGRRAGHPEGNYASGYADGRAAAEQDGRG